MWSEMAMGKPRLGLDQPPAEVAITLQPQITQDLAIRGALNAIPYSRDPRRPSPTRSRPCYSPVMLGGKDGYLALGIAIGFMGALAAFLWVNGFAHLGYCAEGENYGACFREWISALSGWAAAMAAGVSLLALYAQIKEQRKQTDFLVGDALPSVDLMAEDFTTAYVQIVNWNRRAFLIDKIIPAERFSLFARLDEIEIDDVKYAIPNDWDGEFQTAQRVPGRIDANKPPKIARFEVRVFFTGGSIGEPRRQEVTVNVHGRLIGDDHRALVLPARAVVHSY
jgi:hypothetical protein